MAVHAWMWFCVVAILVETVYCQVTPAQADSTTTTSNATEWVLNDDVSHNISSEMTTCILENTDSNMIKCHVFPTGEGTNSTDQNNNTACEEKIGNTTEPERCLTPKKATVSVIDQGILSSEQYKIGEMVCRYLFYPLMASSICLNIINVIVYTDSSMKSPTSTYLIALSVNELLFAALSTVRPILRAIYGVNAVREQIYLIFAMYNSNYILSTLRRLMYCLTVLVSTERFLAVAFPLKARNFRLIKSPPIFIIAISILCFLCNLTTALKFDIVPKPNSRYYTIKPSYFYTHYKDLVLTMQTVNKTLFAYLVLLLGLMMNLFVLVALKMHTKNRQKMNTSVDAEKAAKRERQTTVTILTSTFLFTILALPLSTDSLIQNYMSDYNLYKREHYMNMLMKEVNNTVILLSLSTDFIFYMALSKAYRRTFFKRLPFTTVLCRRQKYLQESTKKAETKISTLSGSVTDTA